MTNIIEKMMDMGDFKRRFKVYITWFHKKKKGNETGNL